MDSAALATVRQTRCSDCSDRLPHRKRLCFHPSLKPVPRSCHHLSCDKHRVPDSARRRAPVPLQKRCPDLTDARPSFQFALPASTRVSMSCPHPWICKCRFPLLRCLEYLLLPIQHKWHWDQKAKSQGSRSMRSVDHQKSVSRSIRHRSFSIHRSPHLQNSKCSDRREFPLLARPSRPRPAPPAGISEILILPNLSAPRIFLRMLFRFLLLQSSFQQRRPVLLNKGQRTPQWRVQRIARRVDAYWCSPWMGLDSKGYS